MLRTPHDLFPTFRVGGGAGTRTLRTPSRRLNGYADIKRQVHTFDRSPDQIKILPGISPFIASARKSRPSAPMKSAIR
jgi:hypothetical protein